MAFSLKAARTYCKNLYLDRRKNGLYPAGKAGLGRQTDGTYFAEVFSFSFAVAPIEQAPLNRAFGSISKSLVKMSP